MKRALVGLVVSVAAVLGGCNPSVPEAPPVGQLVLYLDTDAPLPSGSGRVLGPLDAVPLFDRVRFEGARSDGGPCTDCTREFDVTREMLLAAAVSFGVLAPLAGGGTIRVRLFRGSATVNGDPDPGSTIDVTFALPPTLAEGIAERTLFLHTDDVGNPVGVAPPVATLPGRPSPSQVGTWPGAERHDCSGPAPDGEVCVPGGAYWMGNVATVAFGLDRGDQSRLVVLSPFYVDAQEVTVATYRRLGGALVNVWSGQRSCSSTDYCTWTPTAGPNEGYPLNCIDWPTARAFCTKQGKDLPSEAQFEYIASGLASHLFVWGEDSPDCADAVLDRGGYGEFASYPATCSPPPPPNDFTCSGFPVGGLGLGGPVAPGSGKRDQLTLALPSGQGTIVDLAGNMNEWTLDVWNELTGPCWAAPGVYTDPLCTSGSQAATARGGNWSEAPSSAIAARRGHVPPFSPGAQLGFRCVRPAT
jgi:sulfatase modifying factor 1